MRFLCDGGDMSDEPWVYCVFRSKHFLSPLKKRGFYLEIQKLYKQKIISSSSQTRPGSNSTLTVPRLRIELGTVALKANMPGGCHILVHIFKFY